MASSSSSTPHPEDSKLELQKKVRSHEVAIAELKGLPATRAVYQRNGNIFFRKDIKNAMTSEQEQLDLANAKLKKFNPV